MNENYIEKNWISGPRENKSDMLRYQQWFDSCRSLDECVANGVVDFTHKIFTKDLYEHLGDPRGKTSLEIGFGGGRLVNIAAKIFKKSYGVDLLDAGSILKTREFLATVGNTRNVELLNYSDVNKIDNESIDFAYSFIVFQHFSDISVVEEYLKLSLIHI